MRLSAVSRRRGRSAADGFRAAANSPDGVFQGRRRRWPPKAGCPKIRRPAIETGSPIPLRTASPPFPPHPMLPGTRRRYAAKSAFRTEGSEFTRPDPLSTEERPPPVGRPLTRPPAERALSAGGLKTDKSVDRYSYCPDLIRSTSSRVRNRQAPRLRFFLVRPA